MNDIEMSGTSEVLYLALCTSVGFPTEITIRRDVNDIEEKVSRLMGKKIIRFKSGSLREGFRRQASDIDIMMWSTDHKVIWDYRQCDFYRSSEKTLIMMEGCDARPGFVLLRLLTNTNDKFVKSACIKMNDKIYISSSLYRQATLLCYGGSKSTIHGPCASGRFCTGSEYDLAFCFSYDFWPPCASSFVERSRMKGWPPANVLQDIIDNGCHFVAIGRNNSPQEQNEWRMSFSVAEQKLVYAMSHCQFLCYGMLKIFLKEVLNNNTEEHLLCSYFLKTILFWEVQEQRILTWTPQNILNCIWQCIKHLIKLVYRGECPNFFLPSNNMFHNKVVGSPRARLLSRLYELYDVGMSCLLHCPSISPFMEKIALMRSFGIYYNNSFFMHFGDSELFLSILGTTRWALDKTEFLKMLSICETIQKTQLSVYQLLALQQCIVATLVQTAFFLRFLGNGVYLGNRNKVGYDVDRKICHILRMTAKYGNVSDILNIAMYYCSTCKFKKALHHVEMAKVKLSRSYLMQLYEVDEMKYNGAVRGMSLSERFREAFASDVWLYQNYIGELTLELLIVRGSGMKMLRIPPYVIVSLLSVLCNRDNPRKQGEAIYNLQILVANDDGTFIPFKYKNIAWQILGISQQIIGDFQSALLSYQEALKYTELQMNTIKEATKARIQCVQRALIACSYPHIYRPVAYRYISDLFPHCNCT